MALVMHHEILNWFQERKISQKTLEDMGIYTGLRIKTGDSFEVTPSEQGRIAVFPYLKDGQEVNAKYRAPGKKFYQKPGGIKTFFNADILKDRALQDGSSSLVITEGEMDALAVLETGYPHVVSVPDGAPPVIDVMSDDEIDPEHDTKYKYIINNWDTLKNIRRIIIATDNDGPGRRLAEELVRRLGRVRCLFVEYPPDCKDFNDVLVNYGASTVTRILIDAQPYPVRGIYTFSKLPAEPDFETYTTGWGRLDQYIRPTYPAFMVVTGIAGSGKSTWVNQMVAQMSIHHGWAVAIASFEMRIKPFISDVLINVYKEVGPRNGSVMDWLENSFVFIAPEPSDVTHEFNIDWLIDRAADAVMRHGIRVLVVDPWNEIEHAVKRLENHSDYIGRAIRALKRFGREYNVLVIVVAHPAKYGAQKDPADISLYDISDSAHFANKADYGIVIARVGISAETNVMIKKIRYQNMPYIEDGQEKMTGALGTVPITYDYYTRTFSP